MMINNYNKEKNYIGSDQWQYKFTEYISTKFKSINYTAYIHDNLYKILWNEKYILNLFILKFLFDLVFLFMGSFRSLRNYQVLGVIFTFVLWLILLISSPYYIYKIRAN